jgi:hypothetical protein
MTRIEPYGELAADPGGRGLMVPIDNPDLAVVRAIERIKHSVCIQIAVGKAYAILRRSRAALLGLGSQDGDE